MAEPPVAVTDDAAATGCAMGNSDASRTAVIATPRASGATPWRRRDPAAVSGSGLARLIGGIRAGGARAGAPLQEASAGVGRVLNPRSGQNP